uniref:Uncharacterized protein n=1 Tax=Panagrolaimus sp. ES5 TaxID=591445 RepID=A0AC34EZK4_9BILA
MAADGFLVAKRSNNRDFVWYHGPSIKERIENFAPIVREIDNNYVRFIIYEKNFVDSMFHGKLISGKINVGTELVLMPNSIICTVEQCFEDGCEVLTATSGSFVSIRIRNINFNVFDDGIFCFSTALRCTTANTFRAKVKFFGRTDSLRERHLFTLHYQSKTFPAEIRRIISRVNKFTGVESDAAFMKCDNGFEYIITIATTVQICFYSNEDFAILRRVLLVSNGTAFGTGIIINP